jgi:hypothetical protein
VKSPHIVLFLAFLSLAACKGETSLTLLMQNLHPGIAAAEIEVSFMPPSRGSTQSPAQNPLWSGRIPYSQDEKVIHSKTIRLDGPEIPPGVDCCVRIALALKGEVFSDGNGSWKRGSNIERITIQNQNGIYVRKDGADSLPDDMSAFQVIPLD